jgi:hypothetical protein
MLVGTSGRVNNGALFRELAWTEQRYEIIRARLIVAEKIKSVRGGPGGSLTAPQTPKTTTKLSTAQRSRQPLLAFISYSHKDADLKSALVSHLAPLRHRKLVAHWDDGELNAGEEWKKEIFDQLKNAQLILLLISANFIASDFCYGKELRAALRRDRKKTARVIPIILRDCDWQSLPFAKLQAVPKNGKAITSWSNQDEAMTNATQAIGLAAEELARAR